MADEIIHDSARNRYELTIDGAIAYVACTRTSDTITITHTLVPEELGGRGIGSRLVKHVLDDARRRGDKVIPQCPFVAAYIDKHAKYRDLVASR